MSARSSGSAAQPDSTKQYDMESRTCAPAVTRGGDGGGGGGGREGGGAAGGWGGSEGSCDGGGDEGGDEGAGGEGGGCVSRTIPT